MEPQLQQAKALLEAEHYTCVLKRDNDIWTDDRRGVAPLLALLEAKTDVSGSYAADKVVGKGAAMLYRLLGVKAVWAAVMSKPALQTLLDGGIDATYDHLVEAIADRTGTGLCPMEQATLPLTDPVEALTAIWKKLAQLRG